jgi:hypothetical protein
MESTDSIDLTTRVDDTGAGGISYVGHAHPGSTEASAAWRIKRITSTTVGPQTITKTEYADGNQYFDNIWNNRAALSYS